MSLHITLRSVLAGNRWHWLVGDLFERNSKRPFCLEQVQTQKQKVNPESDVDDPRASPSIEDEPKCPDFQCDTSFGCDVMSMKQNRQSSGLQLHRPMKPTSQPRRHAGQSTLDRSECEARGLMIWFTKKASRYS